jgi:hypothetical protein
MNLKLNAHALTESVERAWAAAGDMGLWELYFVKTDSYAVLATRSGCRYSAYIRDNGFLHLVTDKEGTSSRLLTTLLIGNPPQKCPRTS